MLCIVFKSFKSKELGYLFKFRQAASSSNRDGFCIKQLHRSLNKKWIAIVPFDDLGSTTTIVPNIAVLLKSRNGPRSLNSWWLDTR